jgi:hypothetical protein
MPGAYAVVLYQPGLTCPMFPGRRLDAFTLFSPMLQPSILQWSCQSPQDPYTFSGTSVTVNQGSPPTCTPPYSEIYVGGFQQCLPNALNGHAAVRADSQGTFVLHHPRHAYVGTTCTYYPEASDSVPMPIKQEVPSPIYFVTNVSNASCGCKPLLHWLDVTCSDPMITLIAPPDGFAVDVAAIQ